MPFSHKLFLVGLLILTLSFKVPSDVNQSVQEQDNQDNMVKTRIAMFLAGQGFEPDRAAEPDSTNAVQSLIVASGRSGDCQLLIAAAAPQGWHRYILSRLGSDSDQFFFLFKGRKYRDQPVWLTRLTAYWNIVTGSQVEPVFGIVASAACDVDAMRWQELAENVAPLRR